MPLSANNSLVDQIDQCLPQTQCTLCSFPRCREYASAIAQGNADINQCPPGGEVTIAALAALLGVKEKPLNEEFGEHQPKVVALIREEQCIGCKLCIKACPVDCIVGGPKLMHTVIEDECTGCRLCLPVCPTDCIDMIEPASLADRKCSPWPGYAADQVSKARINTENRLARISRREEQRRDQIRQNERAQMKREIAEALKRKARRNP